MFEMEYNTEKKDFEIEYNRMAKTNGESVPMFSLRVSRPFEIETTFFSNMLSYDMRNGEKIEGIQFSKFSDLAKKLNSKKSVLFSLPQDALEYVRSTAEEKINELKDDAQKQTVKKWYWAIGGDTHQLYVSADVDTEFRPDLKEIEETIQKNKRNLIDALTEKSTKSERETGLYTPAGWFEISNDEMMEIYNSIVEQKEEKKEKDNKERQAMMEKATQTGEKQILSKTHEECNDPEESCDIDEIIEYAMPDGTTKTVRYHTW
jgi:hypothetical protein